MIHDRLPTPRIQRALDQIHDYLLRCANRGQDVRPDAVARHVRGLSRQGRCAAMRYVHEHLGALAAEVEAGLPPLPAVVMGYTTAPAEYDGFGTEQLAVVGTLDGKPLRQVEMEVQHQEWQTMRYGSGMHPCFDETGYQQLFGLSWFTPRTKEHV